ncbi:GlsB/YeaQ/YmgE family stress response membrane protein [Catenulispora pinisilvae]|uniref:GlsB/YeaQ/YmgE family stress response membrane protein n=1 Tax=Catenulispora pinisilvae TaxID=2705253 RepID=UPI001891650B|nr:GlsB/YeaQ/YmgE family stress response membrane protein [Catenulispora pinisilvae]
MFQLLWILILGLILGAVARLLLSGKQDIPIWLTMIVGVVGAWLGNAVAGWIGVRHTGGVDWIRHALQLGFAVCLVALATSMWSGRHQIRR